MATFISIVVAAIVAIAFFMLIAFCVIGVIAGFAHTENEVLDGVVVVSEPSRSIVRDSSGNLYCLKQHLPEDTAVVISLLDNVEPYCAPRFKAIGGQTGGSKVLRRLNDDIVVCEWGKQKIFVECSLEQQQDFLYFTEEMEWETFGDENGPVGAIGNKKQVMRLPYEKAEGEFLFPICVKEA